MDMTTPISDIVESLRAIKVAASERVTALRDELRELEAAFPDLAVAAPSPRIGAQRRRRAPRSAEARAATSVRMKAAWAKRKANGAEAVQ